MLSQCPNVLASHRNIQSETNIAPAIQCQHHLPPMKACELNSLLQSILSSWHPQHTTTNYSEQSTMLFQDLTVFYTRFLVDFGEVFVKSGKGMARHILVCNLCWILNRTFSGILVLWNVVLYRWFLMSSRNRSLCSSILYRILHYATVTS